MMQKDIYYGMLKTSRRPASMKTVTTDPAIGSARSHKGDIALWLKFSNLCALAWRCASPKRTRQRRATEPSARSQGWVEDDPER
jgi:hypothetical protein